MEIFHLLLFLSFYHPYHFMAHLLIPKDAYLGFTTITIEKPQQITNNAQKIKRKNNPSWSLLSFYLLSDRIQCHAQSTTSQSWMKTAVASVTCRSNSLLFFLDTMFDLTVFARKVKVVSKANLDVEWGGGALILLVLYRLFFLHSLHE